MKKILIPLAALILSAIFALAGTPAASADDGNGICVSGPWGWASACVQGPGWVDWNPGWVDWNGGWGGGHHGGHHGHGDD